MVSEELIDSASFNETLQNKLIKTKNAQLSDLPMSLKLISGKLWSCQSNGITVFDEDLLPFRNIKGHGDDSRVFSVVLLPDETIAIVAFNHMYQSSKLGG